MKAILACDPSGGIGYQGRLPWSFLKDDLKRFKELTDGHVIVMGRNTWESLPKKPLPNRLNLVITSKQLDLPPGAISIPSIDKLGDFKNVWVIGGAQLLLSCWNSINEIHLSKTYTKYTCDTFINLVQLKNDFAFIDAKSLIDHKYETWIRKRNATVPRLTTGYTE